MDDNVDFTIRSLDNDANEYYEVVKKGEREPLKMCEKDQHDLQPDGDRIGSAVSYKCTRCIWGTFITDPPKGEESQ